MDQFFFLQFVMLDSLSFVFAVCDECPIVPVVCGYVEFCSSFVFIYVVYIMLLLVGGKLFMYSKLYNFFCKFFAFITLMCDGLFSCVLHLCFTMCFFKHNFIMSEQWPVNYLCQASC